MAESSFSMLRPLYKEFWDYDFLRSLSGENYGSRVFDNDFVTSMMFGGYMNRPSPAGMSAVVSNKNNFEVTINVNKFKPEEITVKTTTENYVIIEGKQEEKKTECGIISMKFTRQYLIPDGVDPETITATFLSGGLLMVCAPRKLNAKDRIVPITIEEQVDDLPQTAVSLKKKQLEEGVDVPQTVEQADGGDTPGSDEMPAK